jgi:hypothetical protein
MIQRSFGKMAACDPLSGRQAADIVGRHLGTQIKLRSAGMTTLRIVSPFNTITGRPQSRRSFEPTRDAFMKNLTPRSGG